MKTKIILINSCKGLYGGIESFLLNVFYDLDPNKYDVTFLTCGESTYGMFLNEITSRGGHVDEIPVYANNIVKQVVLYNKLRRYFAKTKPDIVHINSGGLSFHYVAGKAAKRAHVKEIILHSHNFLPTNNRLKERLKRPFKSVIAKLGTRFLACSRGAAEWIFPKCIIENGKVEIIPNGIDTERFKYNSEKRRMIRDELGIKEELVIGNIGRFQLQKNHEFMIRTMSIVVKNDSDAKLLLAGDGELREHIEQMTQEYELEDNIVFLGERKDMDAFLSSIDVFILPSFHEGLPIAAVEAQTSGAKVLLADTITKETNVSGNAVFLPIISGTSEKTWAKCILSSRDKTDVQYRLQAKELVAKAGYDVKVCSTRMNQIYEGNI